LLAVFGRRVQSGATLTEMAVIAYIVIIFAVYRHAKHTAR
jgi:predicted permease